jgi:DNA-binding XRE family transcriptional regulator
MQEKVVENAEVEYTNRGTVRKLPFRPRQSNGGRKAGMIQRGELPHDVLRRFMVLRERVGVSRAELQRVTGIHSQTVAAWEIGRISPSINNLDAVLRAMGLRLALVRANFTGDEE